MARSSDVCATRGGATMPRPDSRVSESLRLFSSSGDKSRRPAKTQVCATPLCEHRRHGQKQRRLRRPASRFARSQTLQCKCLRHPGAAERCRSRHAGPGLRPRQFFKPKPYRNHTETTAKPRLSCKLLLLKVVIRHGTFSSNKPLVFSSLGAHRRPKSWFRLVSFL
jgi:hypothetical protein